MVNAEKHHKYGHAGHKCLHGIKGICGKPSECNGELQRGHCKGNSNNVCCMKTKQVTLKGDDRSSSSSSKKLRPRYGHKDQPCLHGIKGICGTPSECNGELQRGHCKGNSNNVCCISSEKKSGSDYMQQSTYETEHEHVSPMKENDDDHKTTTTETTETKNDDDKKTETQQEIINNEKGVNDDYHNKILKNQLEEECQDKWFDYRRKRCAKEVKKKFAKCKQYYIKPLHLAIQDGTFEENFKLLVGLSVQESIQKYHQVCQLLKSACKPLTKTMVTDLFRDAESSNKLLMADKNLHWIYRVDILNSNTAKTIPEAKQRCFKLLGFFKSMFHSPWYGFKIGSRNSKYVDLSGHMESVFDPSGKVVIDIKLLGTFNFFGPDEAGAHWDADVEPYKEYDNYNEAFMRRWEEVGSILSTNLKKTCWRMFQSDKTLFMNPISDEESKSFVV